jgi:hypothetical protein
VLADRDENAAFEEIQARSAALATLLLLVEAAVYRGAPLPAQGALPASLLSALSGAMAARGAAAAVRSGAAVALSCVSRSAAAPDEVGIEASTVVRVRRRLKDLLRGSEHAGHRRALPSLRHARDLKSMTLVQRDGSRILRLKERGQMIRVNDCQATLQQFATETGPPLRAVDT